jgi:hypothetical protein
MDHGPHMLCPFWMTTYLNLWLLILIFYIYMLSYIKISIFKIGLSCVAKFMLSYIFMLVYSQIYIFKIRFKIGLAYLTYIHTLYAYTAKKKNIHRKYVYKIWAQMHLKQAYMREDILLEIEKWSIIICMFNSVVPGHIHETGARNE